MNSVVRQSHKSQQSQNSRPLTRFFTGVVVAPFVTRLPLQMSFLVLRVAMAGAIFFGAMMSPVAARADEYGPSYELLSQTIRRAQEQCQGRVACEASGLRSRTLFDRTSDQEEPSTDVRNGARLRLWQRLSQIAIDQAGIWADTILEGDYEADGTTHLDLVEGIYLNDELIAYRITYSERAWHLGDCEYDFEDRSTLNSCQQGRIRESSFVSSSLDSWMRDDSAYAEFSED
jgi:hypothetical protein